MSLSGDDGDDLREYWERLSVGGTVTMPFGVSWLVNIGQPRP